jgi:adenine-specific DNA-methyltransferase
LKRNIFKASDEVAEKLANWNPYDQNARAGFFDMEWMFGTTAGFGIVIANPPYIGEKSNKGLFEDVKSGTLRQFYQGKMDYFYFFFHVALDLLQDSGVLAFITTNYFVTATGADKLRLDLKKRAVIEKLVDLGELKIFEAAQGQHNMVTLAMKGCNPNSPVDFARTEQKGFANPEVLRSIFAWSDNSTRYGRALQSTIYDGPKNYIRLVAKANSLDDVMDIHSLLDKLKAQGTLLGEICNVNQGIVTGADKVTPRHIRQALVNVNKGEGIFVLDDVELDRLHLLPNQLGVVKPWFKNSDISKWATNTLAKSHLLYLDRTVSSIPENLQRHLEQFKPVLSERREAANSVIHWWQLQWPRHKGVFESPKLVAPQRSYDNRFAYNDIPWYASADVYFITSRNNQVALKYLLALLNSKIYFHWLYHRGKRKGEMLELYQVPISEVPIKIISLREQQSFVTYVDQILTAKEQDPKTDVSALERQIDALVYELYGLTDEEIAMVEGR